VSAPPESFLEQYRARWNAVGHHDPLSAGLHAGSEMARGATLRAVSLALANLAAGERVRVGFRPGASYANLQTRRLNVDGNLLEEATADPGKIEPLLAHAIHEGAHIRFTRFVELSDRERKKDGRLLHWIHNIIEDERIEPGIARIYPPLSSALQAERQATREGVPAQWGALEVLFALIRRPDTLPQDAWEEHEKILSAAVRELTPFPEDPEATERTARRILSILPASVRAAAREMPWRLLPGNGFMDGDGRGLRMDGGMLDSAFEEAGEIGDGWPAVRFVEPEAHAPEYESIRREVTLDAQRVASAFACMLPERGRQRARSGRLDRRRLHAATHDDRVFRPVEPRIRGIDVLLVIDLSGSMRGESERLAQRLAITIAEAAMTQRNVRLFVYGHSADVDGETSTLIVRFAAPAQGRVHSLGELPVRGNNRDAHAYNEIAADVEEHAARRARARVALLIGEGAPSANDFHGRAAVEATRDAIAELERRWGPVLVLATDHSPILESLAPKPGAVVEPERAVQGLMAFLARTLGRYES
jgi:Mg-chelatase subunit ChlD